MWNKVSVTYCLASNYLLEKEKNLFLEKRKIHFPDHTIFWVTPFFIQLLFITSLQTSLIYVRFHGYSLLADLCIRGLQTSKWWNLSWNILSLPISIQQFSLLWATPSIYGSLGATTTLLLKEKKTALNCSAWSICLILR